MPDPVSHNGPKNPIVEMRRMVKAYGAARANDEIDWSLGRGTIHALVGENGAGKTTLMRILAGLTAPDSGEIRVDGRPVRLRTPADASRLGIAMVPQRLALVEAFTVAENVALSAGAAVGRPGTRRAVEAARRAIDAYAFDLDPQARASALSLAQRLRVEVLKALIREPRILILDEPTSALAPPEVEGLFAILRRLRAGGRSIVFITHRLPEVMAIADDLTVLRHGRVAGGGPLTGFREDDIARLMIGRELPRRSGVGFPACAFSRPGFETAQAGKPMPLKASQPVLEIEDLRSAGASGSPLRDFTLAIHAGEIVGLAGVDGNGQEALVECLAGIRRPTRGAFRLDGVDVTRDSPRTRVARGLAILPPDRSRGGLALGMTLGENLLLSHQRRRGFAIFGWLRPSTLRRHAAQCIDAFRIEPPVPQAPIRALSGGNQQKALAASRLAHGSRALVAAHPTRGVDLGAIEVIHARLREERNAGTAILLISADLEEIFALSDRIAVLYRGRVAGILPADP
ncbi:MAG: ABC transporter ATP-binding protein [Candidatus Sumerlaeota bacterium]|nr:ABC transporter ATP-binding protein [Candidatus Sumerlaeota bacterium]